MSEDGSRSPGVATVTGSRVVDALLFFGLLCLLVAKAPRLAVYYRSPPAPAPVATMQSAGEAAR